MISEQELKTLVEAGKAGPPRGRVLVKLDPIEAKRKVGALWVVDTSAAHERARRGVVVAVSKYGSLTPEGFEVPYSVKPGDWVLIDRSASEALPRGTGLTPGTLVSIWEIYVLGVIEEEFADVSDGTGPVSEADGVGDPA